LYSRARPIATPARIGKARREAPVAFSPVEEREEGREEPEHLRRIGQEGTPVAIGAEEGEEAQARQEARLRPAGQALAKKEYQESGEQGVEHAGSAQVPQRPAPAPPRGGDPLPEQQRRLGVAHARQLRLQREEPATVGGEPRDVLVGVLVAVLRDVLAVEAV
jgi:hypothetical protein